MENAPARFARTGAFVIGENTFLVSCFSGWFLGFGHGAIPAVGGAGSRIGRRTGPAQAERH
jgi:hypothetical protein